MTTTATKYIYKNLSRTKRIAETPAFQEFSKSRNLSSEAPRSPAEANVLARLFKSNPVKNEPPRMMDGFRRLLGVDAPGEKQEGASGNKKESIVGDDSKKSGKRNEDKAKDVDMVSESESEGDDEEDDEDDDEDDLAQFSSRLANSDSDSENEDPNLDAMSITPSPRPSPEPATKKTKPTSTISSKTPVTSTTFLPSLSMGGYISASDSESDPDPENSDNGGKPQRKNRMGQQARRALWEKKYGAGANHVQKESQKKKRDRDSGWDVRRGATSGGNPREGRGFKGGTGSGLGQGRHHGQAREKPQDDKPIHPSWEAAKKVKEQQQSAASFQGKKVTFD